MSKALRSAAIVAALAASAVLPYLVQLGYYASDPEVLLLSGVATLAGFLLGWAASGFPRLYSAITAFLVYWIADAYFANTLWTIPAAVVGGVLVFMLLQSKYSANIRAMLGVFCIFWIAGNALTPPIPLLVDDSIPADLPTAANPVAPPIVHFIFDELMSPTAVADGFPQGDHPAAHLIDGLVSRGFEVHTNARSNADATHISVSSLFGFANTAENWTDGPAPFVYSVKDNSYLSALRNQGYAVSVYQSNYLRLCAGLPGEACYTYSRNGNGHAYSTVSRNILDRVGYALVEMDSQLSMPSAIRTTGIYILAKRFVARVGIRFQPPNYYSTPAAMLSVLGAVETKLLTLKPGEAVIVHVLLPHAPYILDSSCALRPTSNWSRGLRPDLPAFYSATQIYADYWEQVGCMSQHLDHLIDSTLSSAAGRDAIIMLHGDHGARITYEEDKPNDLVQTMFAIRYGQHSHGAVRPDEVSLQNLFAEIHRTHLP